MFRSVSFRLLVLLAVASYLVYTPIHLATEPHSHDHPHPLQAVPEAPFTGAHHHEHHHQSHPASEHQVQYVRESAGKSVFAAVLNQQVRPKIAKPGDVRPALVFERVIPAGIFLPAPALPRAPPVG